MNFKLDKIEDNQLLLEFAIKNYGYEYNGNINDFGGLDFFKKKAFWRCVKIGYIKHNYIYIKLETASAQDVKNLLEIGKYIILKNDSKTEPIVVFY